MKASKRWEVKKLHLKGIKDDWTKVASLSEAGHIDTVDVCTQDLRHAKQEDARRIWDISKTFHVCLGGSFGADGEGEDAEKEADWQRLKEHAGWMD